MNSVGIAATPISPQSVYFKDRYTPDDPKIPVHKINEELSFNLFNIVNRLYIKVAGPTIVSHTSKIDDKTYNCTTFCSGTQKEKNISPNAKKATSGILKTKAKIFIDFSSSTVMPA